MYEKSEIKGKQRGNLQLVRSISRAMPASPGNMMHWIQVDFRHRDTRGTETELKQKRRYARDGKLLR